MNMLIKSILMILIVVLISGCVYSGETDQQRLNDYWVNNYPDQIPSYTPQSTPTPEPYGNLLIDNISRDLSGFYDRGWQDLYERGEFDCSRMTTYMWDYIRNKYRIAPEIVLAPNREHAWLALRVVDVGDTDRYLQWTGKGVKYYYIEATAPQVVKYEKDFYMGTPPVRYESSADFYTTKTYVADDPVDANTIAGSWFNEFRLTPQDIDKLNSFKKG